jgi:hypothetical protein
LIRQAADQARAFAPARPRAVALGDGDGAQATLARLEEAGETGGDMTRMRAEAALLRGLPRQALSLLGRTAMPMPGACAPRRSRRWATMPRRWRPFAGHGGGGNASWRATMPAS